MNHSERMEMLGQILDGIEGWLDAKGIVIHNPEKDEDQDPYAANIYGTDYGELSNIIESTLINWDLLEEETKVPTETYHVTFAIDGRCVVDVNAERGNIEQIKDKARVAFMDTDLGTDMEIVGSEFVCIEDQDWNIIWEQ